MRKFRTSNKAELDVYKKLREEGYDVIKNGWPDFLAFNKEGDVRFIEVKPAGKRLKPQQKKVRELFESIGLKYEVMHSPKKGTVSKEEGKKTVEKIIDTLQG